MVSSAVADIKELFADMRIIDLDVGKEINTHGNYLVFDGFKPDGMMADGKFNFSLFMALKSLKRGNENAYGELDAIIEAFTTAGEKNIVAECRGIELHKFGERLFIYAVKIEITRSW